MCTSGFISFPAAVRILVEFKKPYLNDMRDKGVTLNPAQSAEFRARAPKIGDLTQSAGFMKFA